MLMSWHLESRVSAAHQLGWKPLQFTLWWRGDVKTRRTSSSSGTPLSLTSLRGAAHGAVRQRGPLQGSPKTPARARRAARKTSSQACAHGEEVKANLPVVPACCRTCSEDGMKGKKNEKRRSLGSFKWSLPITGHRRACLRLQEAKLDASRGGGVEGESVITHCK